MAKDPLLYSKETPLKDRTQEFYQFGKSIGDARKAEQKARQAREAKALEFQPESWEKGEYADYFSGSMSDFFGKHLESYGSGNMTVEQMRDYAADKRGIEQQAAASLRLRSAYETALTTYQKDQDEYNKARTEERLYYMQNPKQHAIDKGKLDEYKEKGPVLYAQDNIANKPLLVLGTDPLNTFKKKYGTILANKIDAWNNKSVTTPRPGDVDQNRYNVQSSGKQLKEDVVRDFVSEMYNSDTKLFNQINTAYFEAGGEKEYGSIENFIERTFVKPLSFRDVTQSSRTPYTTGSSSEGVVIDPRTISQNTTLQTNLPGDQPVPVRNMVPYEDGKMKVNLKKKFPNLRNKGEMEDVVGSITGTGVANMAYDANGKSLDMTVEAYRSLNGAKNPPQSRYTPVAVVTSKLPDPKAQSQIDTGDDDMDRMAQAIVGSLGGGGSKGKDRLFIIPINNAANVILQQAKWKTASGHNAIQYLNGVAYSLNNPGQTAPSPSAQTEAERRLEEARNR